MGDEPDGEQDGQGNAPGRRLRQHQDAGQDAQDAGNQSGSGAEAGAPLQLDLEYHIHNAGEDGQEAVEERDACQSAPGMCDGVKSRKKEQDAQNQVQDAKCSLISHQ